MIRIPVVWHEGVIGGDGRSHYAAATLVNEMFDNTREYDFLHCNTMKEFPADADGGIIVIHGEHEFNKVDQIENDLNRLKWALVILYCDEQPIFPALRLPRPNRKVWIQTPHPTKHKQFFDRFLICGYPMDINMHLAYCDPKSVDRPLDWFFAGQVTHGRRQQCVEELRRLSGGRLHETAGFWQGLERSEYYRLMASAKIIPCPSGPATPDTFRMAEALQAGCVPIIDGTCSHDGYPIGHYWQMVFGGNCPLPILDDWRFLPQAINTELSKWPTNRDRLLVWWARYKASMCDWLRADIEILRGR